ncbi:MAG: SDR family NAD(P)-dependent oxidoreductase [Alphaproteobacteria bacterium]|nr:SDR family NAD(P)-dependent oxidoreductase [Alphaproteobacteria bacterium]MBU0796971.1 SDR family NAD(P)-dependent oxidoreductase [Alphaproteobacteria bacterium]MBU0888346.1 SDR family NAD(P)-dependent oxidoreductase [Alphaproteobacteria bacterium]MBU1814657.1 SDR family NAD(P)-dependent oxidoreductase [Alphaproteobacteria bacterium]MBU2092121.1 SDR family NAD(P)-dependent oxidoreductase [Alphaproteobacteria bacterium]
MTQTGRLAGRIALVTGASRGIGAAIAKRYAAEGAHLILTARTEGALEEVDDAVRAAGGTATLVPLDLQQLDKIDPLGAAINERFGRLDILVANAGLLGDLSPVPHIALKQWDRVMTVNVTANYRLIRSLDPLLRKSESGRGIFVTSGASKGRAFWGLYGTSKAALETLVVSYADELEQTAIKVNLVNPGPIRTAMRASAFPGEDPKTLRTPEEITDCFVDLGAADCTRHGEVIQAY